MQTLIVSDIYGRTEALETISSEILGSVEILDPYESKNIEFRNEKEAYEYFIKEVGLDKYTEDLIKYVRGYCDELYLIGFSVGASAIWNISNHKVASKISEATCFYGSQIRYNERVQPIFLVNLIFPDSESHFSVSDLIVTLSGTEKVAIKQVPFLHGFMNLHSKNYDQKGYNQEIQALCKRAI
jgi:dienelactone hydrolase